MFARVAIILMILMVLVLLTPLALAAVKKAKQRYDQMADDPPINGEEPKEKRREENDW